MAISKEELENEIKKYDLTDSLTILEVDGMIEETKKKLSGELERLREEEPELIGRLSYVPFYKRMLVYENYINRWDKGLFIPNEEELKKFKDFQENFDTKIIPKYDEINRQFSSPEIEEEKAVARKSKKKLDELLRNDEYRQKAEDLLKKYKNNLPFSGNNSDKDIENQFNEQITSLQNQIKDLENRQNQDSSLEKDHKYKKELERLKAELEDLKGKNNQKNFSYFS